jgi:peptide/nickel transport system substrate-binding protein
MKRSAFKTTITAIMVLVAAVFVLGASASFAASKTNPDELVLLEGPAMESMDPAHCGSGICGHIMTLLYDALIEYDLEGNPVVPKLATSWKQSENKVDWIVHLRKDAKFHNGDPITAEAVKASYDRYVNPDTGARRRSVFVAVLKAVTVMDTYTVKFTTFKSFPDMPHLLAFREAAVVHAKIAAERGKAFGQNPVGSGPFKLKEWIRGQHCIVEPFEGYYGAAPKMKRIIYKSVPEDTSRAFALATGEADIVANIPAEEAPELAKDPDIELIFHPISLVISYEMNNRQKPFTDRRVRRALNYAVDKAAIVKSILLGGGSVNNSPTCPGLQYRKAFPLFAYDPEKAKKLLAEAGYGDGLKILINSPSGRYMKDRQVTEAVQAYLTAVGVDAEIKVYEWPPYNQLISSDPRTNKEKSLYMVGRRSPYIDYHLTRLYHTNNILGGSSRTGYSNPEVDRLIEEARFEPDAEKRTELYHKVQKIIFEDAPFLWMHTQTKIYGVRKGVKGVKLFAGDERIMLEEVYKE